MGVSPDDFNAKSPIESAQILDRYIRNIGADDPNDPRIADYLKMQKGYESRAAGQAAFQGQSFNANIDLPYRAAQHAANAEAAGIPALPLGGSFNGNVPQTGFTRDQLLQGDQTIMDLLPPIVNAGRATGSFIKNQLRAQESEAGKGYNPYGGFQ